MKKGRWLVVGALGLGAAILPYQLTLWTPYSICWSPPSIVGPRRKISAVVDKAVQAAPAGAAWAVRHREGCCNIGKWMKPILNSGRNPLGERIGLRSDVFYRLGWSHIVTVKDAKGNYVFAGVVDNCGNLADYSKEFDD